MANRTTLRVLTSESRRKRERRPFPQESVGGLRKDEVQWMSLALLGDRKLRRASGLKISPPITPHEMYFSSTSLPLSPYLLLSEDMLGWC